MIVTRLRPPGFDKYGEPITGPSAELVIPGCSVAPRFPIAARETASGAIEDRGREGAIIGLTLYGPYKPDILSTDFIRIDDRDGTDPVVYKVEGAPVSWRNPFTRRRAGSETSLKITDG